MVKKYFTVGPSQIYPKLPMILNNAVKQDILSLSHRGSEFKKIYGQTSDRLKLLLRIPKDYQVLFVSSALEAMERTIQGLVEKRSFHLITGAFGKSWAKIAIQLGKEVETLEVDPNIEVKIDEIKIPKNSELICITQNETSLGVYLPEKKIEELRKKNPGKILAVDIVSSVPYVNLNFKYIDVAFFSVQKGFGLPAGLGVIIISPRALEKIEELFKKGLNTGSYHSLKNLFSKALEFQTPETPNVLTIYLLNEVLKDMLKIGIKKIRQQTDKKAAVLYNFFENHKNYSPFIKIKKFQSKTTLVIDVNGNSEKLRKKLSKKGFVIASGYGDNKQNHIRIANFPTQTLKDIRKMLKYLV